MPPDPSIPARRLAAILFTDMVGFSALTQRDERMALALRDEQRRRLRALLPAHQGHEVETAGDSFLIEFPSALDAVECAVAIQQDLHQRNRAQPADRQIHLRIGIHLGDILHTNEGVFGDGVNIAARIEPLAPTDGICLSHAVYDQIAHKVAWKMEPLPEQALKNIQTRVQIYQLVIDPVAPAYTGAMTEGAPGARIAHVLSLDLVGFAAQPTPVQARWLERLTACIHAAPTFVAARARNAVLPLAAADGVTLLFFDEIFAPARSALELAQGLAQERPALAVRMGIHSGLIQTQIDIAGKESVLGEGINTARRVREFGEAGHILLSDQYAGWLAQFEDWSSRLTPVGEGDVGQGQRIVLHALSTGAVAAPRPVAPPPTATAPTAPAGQIALLAKRDAEPDGALLDFLEAQFSAAGYTVFADRQARFGVTWAREVEERLRGADAVVAIVSPRSYQSEMLEFELETAWDQAQKTGKPTLLPVLMGPAEEMPGPVAAIVRNLPQFLWSDPADDRRLAAELLSAIREPLRTRPEEVKLEPVGGAVPPESPFYVERACDAEFHGALENGESIVLVKGARQIGKTSLLARGILRARQAGHRCVVTDFQKLSAAQFGDQDRFYRLLAALIAKQLRFEYDFEGEWDDLFGANLNLESFLRALLEDSDVPVVWFLDEVDKLFAAPFASDFFGLVRSWHNARSTEPGGCWDRLTVVIAYATEAHLFIQDLNQSPFNVGRRLELDDFTLQQMLWLNERYGSTLTDYAAAEGLYALLGGQPFLTRKALDALATGRWSASSLLADADRDDGPFADHLKRLLVGVSTLPGVTEFARSVVRGESGKERHRDAYYRLLAAGIVHEDREGRLAFRCELYRRYLSRHLG